MDQYGITDGSYGLHVEADPSLGVAGDTFLRTLGEVSPATARAEPAPMAGGRADPVEAIVALLVGTRNDRFGPRMDAHDHEVIRAHVGHWVGAGQPVHLLIMWGGLKHYVTDEEQGIDLAELFAVRQMSRLARTLGEIYPPGLRILVYLEDFGVWYEDACGYGLPMRSSVERNIETYIGEFAALLRAVSPDSTRALRFRDLIGASFDARVYERQADRNTELLHAYWRESAARPSAAPGTLDSYRRLEEVGWSGHILPEMRQHYLQRLTRLYPAAPLDEKVDRLLRYFAIVLLYQQSRLFAGMGGPLIKVSMYKPAPGIPDQRISGRIHLRVLSRRVTSQVMPPWTCKGCFRLGPDGQMGVALQSFPLARESRLRFAKGRLRVTRGEHTASVRADVLLPETIPGGSYLSLREWDRGQVRGL